jgi:hypothetical protein
MFFFVSSAFFVVKPCRTERIKMKTRLILLLSFTLAFADALAWGPHPTITRAALDRVPEMERWQQALGASNLNALTNYCLMPDLRGTDRGEFYADDYLLIRPCPQHISHVMPFVQETFVPYFRRALQALRTETPANACRFVGSLIHFVEDTGAPPHAKEKCPRHKDLENWVRADQIAIPDYQPQLLGKTDAEAEAALLRRLEGLVAFSTQRAERALPVKDRAEMEPILLESALESSRVAADVLYTVFTLGLAPQTDTARLTGTIRAAEFPRNDKHGARVVLLNTDYTTLTTGERHGAFEFHQLPAGTYRVLAYRTASQFRISPPVTVKAGETARVDLKLPATEPAGNMIENPDAKLAYLPGDWPDRWKGSPTNAPTAWTSTTARVTPGATYRCGAEVKDDATEIKFIFQGPPGEAGKNIPPQICSLPLKDGARRAEMTVTANAKIIGVAVQVKTKRPVGETIEKVWVVAR